MSVVINLSEHRRARDLPPQEWRHRTIEINDHCTLHEVSHEQREVVQAGITFFITDVESIGPGGWGVFGEPLLLGSEYVSTGVVVRFPDAE